MAAQKVLKTGKRKTSVARVFLSKGKGSIMINNEKVESYVPNELLRLKVKEPLLLAEAQDKYDVKVNVFGGGQTSQVDAIRQGIARALVEMTGSDDLKKKFLEYDRSLLVSDPRFKEMRKPNCSKARAKRQKSYR
ncbi:MAG: 30S ribosomal protein S9 [Candidatus Woesearchaeota archaeon]|jgi:small subunit ribosomal protein S9|nr:30S ribosomal protein S9 [Candidatus Woesearchaeota archaeon]